MAQLLTDQPVPHLAIALVKQNCLNATVQAYIWTDHSRHSTSGSCLTKQV